VAATLQTGLGLAIRERRRALGLSQDALAERSGLDRLNVGRIERGERSPRLDTLARIADALDVRPWELLREAEG
jgi:transcriptional regulator with XRE-family HTH domain